MATASPATLLIPNTSGPVSYTHLGCDEAVDRQSHLMTEESGCDVAEVAARYADNQLVGETLLLHAGIGLSLIHI